MLIFASLKLHTGIELPGSLLQQQTNVTATHADMEGNVWMFSMTTHVSV